MTNQKLTLEDANAEHIAIEASLTAWYCSLPAWMQTPGVAYNNVSYKCDLAAHWICAYCLTLYHACTILLHKHRLPINDNDTSLRAMTSFSKCFESTRTISYLASIFQAQNPQFHYVCPFICSFLFEAGMIWLSLAKLSTDSLIHAMCHQGITLLTRCLEQISTYFVVAKNLKDTLEKASPIHMRLQVTIIIIIFCCI